jgi:hypothetical protein
MALAEVSIASKLPSDADPEVFEAKLRGAGLERGKFLFGEAAVEDWWLGLWPEGTRFDGLL